MKKEAKPDFVKWFFELNKNSVNIAGGKGANLAEIYNLKLSVPPGFVITAQAYDYFIEKAGIENKIKEILDKINYEDTSQLDENTKEIRELIMNSKIPKEMEDEILESYENLNVDNKNAEVLDILKKSSEPVFVAVRSSATAEDLATASFAGQQDSFVNVKGNLSLLQHIKKCFASLFTSRATYYRNKKGFKHENVRLAVVIQKMVDSDKSGVIFSKDPSYKNNNTIIESVFGLGEGIVSGQISPDKYVVSEELEILDKKITDKKIAITKDSEGRKKIIKLKEEKSKSQVLSDYEIKKLTEFSLKLEEHYKKPQDIEFAIEGEDIYIVQTRPITTMESRFENIKEIKGEFLLSGIAASPGIAFGKVKIIRTMTDLPKIKQGDILVTKMTNPDMVVTMQKSAAIVTDEGGLTSHASIVSREMGIACVVGTQEATKILKENEIITVNGFDGKIYRGKVSETIQKEILPVVETKTKIKVIVDLPSYAERASESKIDSVGLMRIEGIIAESGKHPNYFLEKNTIKDYEEIIFKGINGIAKYFEEVWVRTSDIRSDEFANLEGASKETEINPMLGMHGIRAGLKDIEILKAELNAMKKVSEKGKKIGILLPQIISVNEVQEVKKILEEIDFKNAKLGVMIETPASVEIITELCKEKIDFISFGTNDLTQYTLAIDRGNENVQYIYDEMHPAVLHQLEHVIKICKEFGVETSICGQAGSNKNMVEFLVKRGIDSISVNADAAYEISKFVAELEGSQIQEEKPVEEIKNEEKNAEANASEDDKENNIEQTLIEVEPSISSNEILTNNDISEPEANQIEQDKINEVKENKDDVEQITEPQNDSGNNEIVNKEDEINTEQNEDNIEEITNKIEPSISNSNEVTDNNIPEQSEAIEDKVEDEKLDIF